MQPTNPTSDSSDARAERTAKNHHETTVEGVMGKVTVEPDAARFNIGKMTGQPLVDVSINNDALSMRLFMEPDEAERIGERLLNMAEEARQ